jgi:hypothetical protein
MSKPPVPDQQADMPEDGGDKPLDSHVQADAPVYGEPKGPRPGSMFRHSFATAMPPDRERGGFVGGRAEIGLGDMVGSGPEEWRRAPADADKKAAGTEADAPDPAAPKDGGDRKPG